VTQPSDEHPESGDATSSVPGYQPTERLDLAQLARAVADRTEDDDADDATRPAGSAHEPLEEAAGPRPRPSTERDAPAAPENDEDGVDPDDEPVAEDDEQGAVEPTDDDDEPTEQHPTTTATPALPAQLEPSPSTGTAVIERETAEIVRRLPRPAPLEPSPERRVTVVDLPVYRLRRPGDLVAAALAVLGVVLVLLLAVFAHATTEGVTQDVSDALPPAVKAFLLAPLNILEGVVTLVLPLVIAVVAFIGRRPRQVGEGVIAGGLAAAIVVGGNWLLATVGPEALVNGVQGKSSTAFIPVIGALAAYLTVMGTSDRRRFVTWTWNLLWLTLVLQVLRSGMSLPGALASVLAGRAVGLGVRYAMGVLGDRAYGEGLVVAMRRCGIDPERILRIVDGRPLEGVEPETVVTDAPIGYVTEEPDAKGNGDAARRAAPAGAAPAGDDAVGGPGEDEAGTAPVAPPRPRARDLLAQTWDFSTELPPVREEIPEELTAQVPQTPEPRERQRPPLRAATAVVGEEEGENRIYSVRDVAGRVWDVGVLDGDRQVVGTLAATWNTLRLRGPSHRTTVSLRASVDRAALMAYAVEAAGVRTPRLRGLTLEDDSAVLVSEHVPGTQVLADVQTRRLTDHVLDGMWHQLRTAHAAGIAHRNLDDHAILLDGDDQVLLTGWSQGETSSPRLSRRLDVVALLALLALRVGPERAMASAVRNLTREDLQAIAPIFQIVVLPERTRPEARRNKKVLKEVQGVLLGILPSGTEVAPVQMRRFSGRTVITATVASVAAVIVLTQFNISEMIGFARGANPYFMAVAFLLGLATYVGSAMALVAFSPERLSLWRTTLVQVAASIVGLVAPAGVGPAALNLRFLQKNRLDTPMAVATVALVQVSQFITTVLLLLSLALVTGSTGALDGLPSGAVLLVVLGVVLVLTAALFVPRVRRWVLAKIMPTVRQIWPRLVWVIAQPGRLVAALVGNVIMTVGYIAAFGFTLLAFDQSLPVTSLSIVYLAGNTAGAMVPTPGGIGAVELALTSGLTAAGVGSAVALATAFVFRLVTFWVRIPLGWLALQWLQKRNLV